LIKQRGRVEKKTSCHYSHLTGATNVGGSRPERTLFEGAHNAENRKGVAIGKGPACGQGGQERIEKSFKQKKNSKDGRTARRIGGKWSVFGAGGWEGA